MDYLVWRFRARVVAFSALFLCILSEAYVVISTIEALIAISRAINNKFAVWVALLVILLQNILIGAQFWTTLKLLSATKLGNGADEALKKSRIWLKANVAILVIGAMYKIFSIYAAIGAPESIIWIIAFIIVYGLYMGMMLIVFKFIQELERTVTFGDSAIGTKDLDFEL